MSLIARPFIAPAARPESAHPEWPEYCCAILRNGRGRYLLDRRAPSAKDAPGKLACFGGKREPGEHPDRCLRREIKEELGWSTGALHMDVSVRLMARAIGSRSERVVAWFYRGKGPREGLALVTLPGSAAVWATAEELAGPLRSNLSAWHRVAMDAEARGDAIAWIEE